MACTGEDSSAWPIVIRLPFRAERPWGTGREVKVLVLDF